MNKCPHCNKKLDDGPFFIAIEKESSKKAVERHEGGYYSVEDALKDVFDQEKDGTNYRILKRTGRKFKVVEKGKVSTSY